MNATRRPRTAPAARNEAELRASEAKAERRSKLRSNCRAGLEAHLRPRHVEHGKRPRLALVARCTGPPFFLGGQVLTLRKSNYTVLGFGLFDFVRYINYSLMAPNLI